MAANNGSSYNRLSTITGLLKQMTVGNKTQRIRELQAQLVELKYAGILSSEEIEKMREEIAELEAELEAGLAAEDAGVPASSSRSAVYRMVPKNDLVKTSRTAPELTTLSDVDASSSQVAANHMLQINNHILTDELTTSQTLSDADQLARSERHAKNKIRFNTLKQYVDQLEQKNESYQTSLAECDMTLKQLRAELNEAKRNYSKEEYAKLLDKLAKTDELLLICQENVRLLNIPANNNNDAVQTQNAHISLSSEEKASTSIYSNLGSSIPGLTPAMENGNCTSYDATKAYMIQPTSTTTGGGEDTEGGGIYGGLENYADSSKSKAKSLSLRGIATALKSLKLKIDLDKSDKEIAKQIQSQLPDPSKGKTFASDAKSKKEICKMIAVALNKQFSPDKDGEQLIDLDQGPEGICLQITEIVHALGTDMHAEYLEVYSGLKQALKNMQFLKTVMSSQFETIAKAVDQDKTMTEQTAKQRELFINADQQMSRYIALIKSLLHVTLRGVEDELVLMINKENDTRRLVHEIGLLKTSPDKDMTNKSVLYLVDSIGGLGRFGYMNALLNAALKKAGMELKEYLASNDYTDLVDKLTQLEKIVAKNGDPDKLVVFLKAAKTLKQHYHNRQDLVTKGAAEHDMSGSSDFEGGYSSGSFGGGDDIDGGAIQWGDGKTGGDSDDDAYEPKRRRLDKRIKKAKYEKSIIMKAFAKRANSIYESLYHEIAKLGPELGYSIPLSDKTEALKLSLARLEFESDQPHHELYLAGYFADADARIKKDKFVSILEDFRVDVEAIAKDPKYSKSAPIFKRISAIAVEIQELVRTYSATFTSKFGGTSGGSSRETDIDAIISKASTTRLELKKAVNAYNYFHYIADVRENLKHTSKELASYRDGYVEVIGEAFNAKKNDIEKERTDKLKKLEDFFVHVDNNANRAGTTPYNNFIAAGIANVLFLPTSNAIDAERPQIRKRFKTSDDKCVETGFTTVPKVLSDIINDEANTKLNFYKSLEGLEMYLSVFTSDIVNDPGAMMDINSIFEETKLFSQWYNETSGNELAKAFDQFPGFVPLIPGTYPMHEKHPTVNAQDPHMASHTLNDSSSIDHTTTGIEHYYLRIRNSLILPANRTTGSQNLVKSVAYPGVPVAYISVKKDDETDEENAYSRVVKSVDATYDNFMALKNIINAFARIGQKFNGGSVESNPTVFMSATQLYTSLLTYLKKSAISTGWCTESIDGELLNGVNSQIVNCGGRGVIDAIFRYRITDTTHLMAGTLNNNEMSFHPGLHLSLDDGSTRFSFNSVNFEHTYTTEDKYFSFMMKAILGKIMTAIGVFDLMKRPTPVYNRIPTRIILGGSTDRSTPVEAIPEVAELYFRLPRLLEFYYDIFKWDTSTTIKQVAMLDDFESGPFKEIVKYVFTTAVDPLSGTYSTGETDDIIEIINTIYQAYSSKGEGTIRKILLDLVAEVNRRYGVIKKSEHDEWDEIRRSNTRTGTTKYPTNEHLNYNILPDEDVEEFERPSLSDRHSSFARVKPLSTPNTKAPRWSLDKMSVQNENVDDNNNWDIVDKLRKNIDSKFDPMTPTTNSWSSTSYKLIIREAAAQMKTAESKDRRDIARSLIRSSTGNDLTETNALLTFNETVVTGLNMLTGIYNQLSEFRDFALSTDYVGITKHIVDSVKNLETSRDKTIEHISKYVGLPTAGKHGLDLNDVTNEKATIARGHQYGEDLQVKHLFNLERSAALGTRMRADDCTNKYVLYADVGLRVNEDQVVHQPRRPIYWRPRREMLAWKCIWELDSKDAAKDYHRYRNHYIRRSGMIDQGLPTEADIIALYQWCSESVLSDSEGSNAATIPAGQAERNQLAELRSAMGQHLARFAIDSRKMMMDIINTTYGLDSGTFESLVDVRVPSHDNSELVIDFSKLKSAVTELFNEVKTYLNVLRLHLPATTVQRFEADTIVGSVGWLESHLMDDLIHGVRGDDVRKRTNANELPTLDGACRIITGSYKALIEQKTCVVGTDKKRRISTHMYCGVQPIDHSPAAEGTTLTHGVMFVPANGLDLRAIDSFTHNLWRNCGRGVRVMGGIVDSHDVTDFLENDYSRHNTAGIPPLRPLIARALHRNGNVSAGGVFYDGVRITMRPLIIQWLQNNMLAAPVIAPAAPAPQLISEADIEFASYDNFGEVFATLTHHGLMDGWRSSIYPAKPIITSTDQNSGSDFERLSSGPLDTQPSRNGNNVGYKPPHRTGMTNDQILDSPYWIPTRVANTMQSRELTNARPPAAGAAARAAFDALHATGVDPSSTRVAPYSTLEDWAPRMPQPADRQLREETMLRKIHYYDTATGTYGGNRSILSIFNQTLAKYISIFIDAASGKIYTNLLEPLMSGHISSEILGNDGQEYPDMMYFNRRNKHVSLLLGDPHDKAIVYRSIKIALRNIARKRTTQNGVSSIDTQPYVERALSEVPTYMKETYSSQLPIFARIFKSLVKKTKFLSDLIARTGVKLDRAPYGKTLLSQCIGREAGVVSGSIWNGVQNWGNIAIVNYSNRYRSNAGCGRDCVLPRATTVDDMYLIGAPDVVLTVNNLLMTGGDSVMPDGQGVGHQRPLLVYPRGIESPIMHMLHSAGGYNVATNTNDIWPACKGVALYPYVGMPQDQSISTTYHGKVGAILASRELMSYNWHIDDIMNHIHYKTTNNTKTGYNNALAARFVVEPVTLNIGIFEYMQVAPRIIMTGEFNVKFSQYKRHIIPILSGQNILAAAGNPAAGGVIATPADSIAQTINEIAIRPLVDLGGKLYRTFTPLIPKIAKGGAPSAGEDVAYRLYLDKPISTKSIHQLVAYDKGTDVKAKLLRILSSLGAVSHSLQATCDEVAREINNEIRAMEPTIGHIELYKSRFNAIPLAPLSMTLAIMNAQTAERVLVPNQASSENNRIALSYQTILDGKLSESTYPGITLLIETFEKLTRAFGRVDNASAGYLKFAKVFGELLSQYVSSSTYADLTTARSSVPLTYFDKYMYDTLPATQIRQGLLDTNNSEYDKYEPQGSTNIRRPFAGHSSIASIPEDKRTPVAPAVYTAPQITLINDAVKGWKSNRRPATMSELNNLINTGTMSAEIKTIEDNHVIALDNEAYSIGAENHQILDVYENEDRVTSIQNIVNKLNTKTGKNDPRSNERLHNLVDANIIPINVHALQRDVVLAHVYNYAYTFDTYLMQSFGSVNNLKSLRTGKFNERIEQQGRVTDIRSAFVFMTCNPHTILMKKSQIFITSTFSINTREGHFDRIMVGNDNLAMGRPKYLSDQLFNKVLLQGMYTSYADEHVLRGGVMYVDATNGPRRTDSFRHLNDGTQMGITNAADNAEDIRHQSFTGVAHAANMIALQRSTGSVTPNNAAILERDKLRNIIQYQVNARSHVNNEHSTLTRVVDHCMVEMAHNNKFLALTYISSKPSSNTHPNNSLRLVIFTADATVNNMHTTYLVHALNSIAMVRFDTTIVRNLIFITNLHRILRKAVSDEMTHYRSVIVSANRAPNRGLTEFDTTPQFAHTETSTDAMRHDERPSSKVDAP